MAFLTTHDINNPDAYVRPVFDLKSKIKRLVWNVTWILLCSWTPNPMHKWRIFILRLFGAKIGKTNFIYPNCKIWAPWLLETEDVVTIGPRVELYNPGGIFLADHSILSQDSYICGATHNYNSIDFSYQKKRIHIGRYAWICARAIVLPGVTCGDGSVLGAGAVTSKNLDSWTVYAGNPAVKVKNRSKF